VYEKLDFPAESGGSDQRMDVRLEDVARRAKVSVSTASRVVNGLESVSGSTRRRVLAALEELNYMPNLQARSLVSGQSKTLGVIVSNLENPFFIDLFRLLEEQAHEQGFEILLANTNYDPKHLERAIRTMLGRRVAGLAIAVSEPLPQEVHEAVRAKIPVVCFGGKDNDQMELGRVRLDTHAGMRKLVEHLHALGHRSMAYVGHQLSLATTEERREAFEETTRRLGIEYTYLAVLERDGPGAGRDAVRELVHRGIDVSAILCLNDNTAIGVLRELRNRNLRVPEDISVTGFDDVILSEFSCPSLTTVHIPRREIARMMFRMLTARDSPTPPPMQYLIDSEVVIRESTGPYRGGGLLLRAEEAEAQ
jgi:LacI family transcriptional regulator